jgi:hypothetical protein
MILEILLPIIVKYDGIIYGGFIRDYLVNQESTFHDIDIMVPNKKVKSFCEDLRQLFVESGEEEKNTESDYKLEVLVENDVSIGIKITHLNETVILDITQTSIANLIRDSYVNLLFWKPTYESKLLTNFDLSTLGVISNDRNYTVQDVCALINRKSFVLLPSFKEKVCSIQAFGLIMKMKEINIDFDIETLLVNLRPEHNRVIKFLKRGWSLDPSLKFYNDQFY